MSKPADEKTINSFGTLFERLYAKECVTHCELFAACGGRPKSAPCACAWPSSSGKRHKCESCPIICRERRKPGPDGLGFELDFTAHVNAGSMLEQVTVHQASTTQFPLFIPTNTQHLKNIRLPLRWAAADIKTLLNVKNLKAYFATHQSTQEYLRVGPDCKLIAVLNGKDSSLEKFWALERRVVLKQLRSSGFSVGTGATFSVNDVIAKKTSMPHSHNVTMLMRHHRVMQEIQAADMETIPNLYWIDGDRREMQQWAEWLMINAGIHTITRDFSSTRDTQTVMSKLYELITLLNTVGRSFHVLIVGTGCHTAPLALRALAEAGHSGSIITAAPVHAAHANVKYRLDDDGQIIDEQLANKSTPFPILIRHNMEVFEQALFKAVAGIFAEQNALPNVLGSSF